MASENRERTPESASVASFATTQWSVVLSAGRDAAPEAKAALDELCRAYWRPLYAYLRRSGCSPEEAEDVVQGFFARLWEKGDLAAVSPDRGRFRSFLLAAVKHYLANERDRARAAKRGGRRQAIPLDVLAAEAVFAADAASTAPPDAAFDRQWALTLLDRVQERLREEFTSAGKGERFEHLQPLLSGEGSCSYREAAAALGLTENAMMVAVHRLRGRFRELLREEIARTVSGAEQIDEEIRDLFAALRKFV